MGEASYKTNRQSTVNKGHVVRVRLLGTLIEFLEIRITFLSVIANVSYKRVTYTRFSELLLYLLFLKNNQPKDFPGGAVVKESALQCRGPMFDPGLGN